MAFRVNLVCFVYLVDLVHLVDSVSLVQPNKQDKPNKPNNDLLLLRGLFAHDVAEEFGQRGIEGRACQLFDLL